METHFIPLFDRVIFLWGDMGKYGNRKRLLQGIYDFLEIWTMATAKDRDFEKIKKHSLIVTAGKKETILKESGSYSDIIHMMFEDYAKIHGTSRWGDKSAFYHHSPLERLQNIFNKFKVIHIIRDGRDVSLSWREIWTGPETVAESARVWANHIREKRRWGKQNPEKYLEIKYEDLLVNTELVLGKICSFLDISIEKKRLNFLNTELAEILSAGPTHKLLSKPIVKENKEKWKTKMPENDQLLFEYIAGPVLADCGYETQILNIDCKTRVLLILKITYSRILELFTLRYLNLKLKMILPLILFICNILHIPLVKILNRNYKKT